MTEITTTFPSGQPQARHERDLAPRVRPHQRHRRGALAAGLARELLIVVTGGGIALGAFLSLSRGSPANGSERRAPLGKFVGLRGPGLFWIIPLLDEIVVWIDVRVRTTGSRGAHADA